MADGDRSGGYFPDRTVDRDGARARCTPAALPAQNIRPTAMPGDQPRGNGRTAGHHDRNREPRDRGVQAVWHHFRIGRTVSMRNRPIGAGSRIIDWTKFVAGMQQTLRQMPLIEYRTMILLEILSEFASRGIIW